MSSKINWNVFVIIRLTQSLWIIWKKNLFFKSNNFKKIYDIPKKRFWKCAQISSQEFKFFNKENSVKSHSNIIILCAVASYPLTRGYSLTYKSIMLFYLVISQRFEIVQNFHSIDLKRIFTHNCWKGEIAYWSHIRNFSTLIVWQCRFQCNKHLE